jgi:hypothetical protein
MIHSLPYERKVLQEVLACLVAGNQLNMESDLVVRRNKSLSLNKSQQSLWSLLLQPEMDRIEPNHPAEMHEALFMICRILSYAIHCSIPLPQLSCVLFSSICLME